MTNYMFFLRLTEMRDTGREYNFEGRSVKFYKCLVFFFLSLFSFLSIENKSGSLSTRYESYMLCQLILDSLAHE